MASWLSRSKKSSVTNLRVESDALARSTTPTPGNPDGKPQFRSGVLTIRVLWAEDLSLPTGTSMPAAVHATLASQQAKVAASVSPSSVHQHRLAKSRGNRLLEFSLPPNLSKLGRRLGIASKEPSAGGFHTSSWNTNDVSRNSEISLQLYLRAEEPKRDADGLAADLGNDIFMGGIKFIPNFDEMGSRDQWYDVVGGTGKIQIGTSYLPSYGQSLTVDDFELITVIGKGSFGKVMQVRKRDTQRIYALKTIRKIHIVNRNEITHTLAERLVLAQVNSPFIVPLKFSFQSEQKLYLVLA
ncbi:hypothetical protein H0H93_013414 [Arthromyces matolae]|nr:hypothetical protein H0H93_013414 [Arthromyces matolae]